MDVESKSKKICICPNCGNEMKISFNDSTSYYVCPECGCSMDSEIQNYDWCNICPNCNQEIDDNECSYCGYDLGSDFD